MPKSTNLIFFLSDNHARSMLGCYGHPMVHTPNLDWISETGVRFDNAYCASSLCCPSRAAIATGLYAARNLENLNNDKLCSFTYSYNVELLLKMAHNGYLLLIGEGE